MRHYGATGRIQDRLQYSVVLLFVGMLCSMCGCSGDKPKASPNSSVKDRGIFDDLDGPKTKEPIDIITGDVTATENDIRIPCPLVDLVFSRHYHSRLDHDGAVGQHWGHSYDLSATSVVNAKYKGVSGDWVVVQVLGDPGIGVADDRYWFEDIGDGSYKLRGDSQYRLKATLDGGHEFLIPGGISCAFDSNGCFVAINSAAGSVVTLNYTNGTLLDVRHRNGKLLAFSYDDDDKIVRVNTPSTNLSVSFTYNSLGELTNACRHTSTGNYNTGYTYDSVKGYRDHLLTEITDPNGDIFLYEYHFEDGIARGSAMQTVGGRFQHRVEYPSLGQTIVSYRNGDAEHIWDYNFNPVTNRLNSITGPNDTHWRKVYRRDANMNLTETMETNALSGCYSRFSRTFDSFHNVLSYQFDYCGNSSATWSFVWNTNDMTLASATDPEGAMFEYSYTNGLLQKRMLRHTSETNAQTWVYAYDSNGLLTNYMRPSGGSDQYLYDASGYLTNSTPAAGPSVSFVNNDLGWPVKIVRPGRDQQRVTSVVRNEWGQPIAVTNADNSTRSLLYDGLGNLLSNTDTGGRTTTRTYELSELASITRVLTGVSNTMVVTSFERDQQFNTIRVIDPLGRNVEVYQLDGMDRLVGVTNLEGQAMAIKYALHDGLDEVTRFDSSTVQFERDTGGRISKMKFASLTNEFTYLRNGLLKMAINEQGVISNSHDGVGRTVSSQGVGPASRIEYSYLPSGQLTGVVSVAGVSRYSYDAADRLSNIVSDSGEFGFGFDKYNGLIEVATNVESGLKIAYTYDVVDRVTNMVWMDSSDAVIGGYAYSYGAAGMITQKVSILTSSSEIEVYTYDSLDRLTSESRLGGAVTSVVQYTYDLTGNRKTVTTDGAEHTYTLGQGNRLAAWGTNSENSVTYDAAGNVTDVALGSTGLLHLIWNDRYQLIAAETNGVEVESHGYDALGRRVWIVSDGNTNHMVYDGTHVIADLDGTGEVIRSYVWGPGIDNLLAMSIHTGATVETYYPITDHLGSIHALVDDTGSVVESYKFDAWGKILEVRDSSGELSIIKGHWSSPLGNRYLWQGREYSWTTELYNFRARWYDPVTGRWLSKDPIGISGGLNQYTFCADNPVMFSDATGLRSATVLSGIRSGLSDHDPIDDYETVNEEMTKCAPAWWNFKGQLDRLMDDVIMPPLGGGSPPPDESPKDKKFIEGLEAYDRGDDLN